MKNELQFLADLHKTGKADRWGWTQHVIGAYLLSTNGTAWTAVNMTTGRRINLRKVMKSA